MNELKLKTLKRELEAAKATILQDVELAGVFQKRAEAAEARVDESERAFNETMIRLRETEHLLSLAQDQLDAALLRIAKLERRDGEWVHDCGRLQEKLDTAQAHAARLVDVCKQLIGYRDRAGALNFQLEKADDYHRMIRAALSAVPAELLNELELDAMNKGARELAHLLLHDQGAGKLSPGPCADALALWRALEAEHTEAGKHPLDLGSLYDMWRAVEAAKAKGGQR